MSNSKEAFMTLTIETDYPDFHSFYTAHKESIYFSIVETFEALSKLDTPSLDFRVSAIIKGLKWDTDFTLSKKESIMLTRDILPFFVEKENYEVCSFITQLYEQLSRSEEVCCLS
jgi:hypothetical protein